MKGFNFDGAKFTHSYEAEMTGGNDYADSGFMGSPVKINFGGEYLISDKTTVNCTAKFGKTTEYNHDISHKWSDKWTLHLGQ